MINFGINDTLYKYRLNNSPISTDSLNTTNQFKSSAISNYQTPVITDTATNCTESLGRYQVKMDTENNKKQSIEQYIDNLKKLGKKEGKDFEIEHFPEYNNFNLYEYDNNKRIIKTTYWTNGNQESNYAGYDITTYNDDIELTKAYRGNGNLVYVSEKHKNIPEKELEDSQLINTSPDDYCKTLKAQGKIENKDFKIEKEIVGNSKQIFIDEISSNGVREKSIWWIIDEKGGMVSVSSYDKNGNEKIRKTYGSDNTYGITRYTDEFNKN